MFFTRFQCPYPYLLYISTFFTLYFCVFYSIFLRCILQVVLIEIFLFIDTQAYPARLTWCNLHGEQSLSGATLKVNHIEIRSLVADLNHGGVRPPPTASSYRQVLLFLFDYYLNHCVVIIITSTMVASGPLPPPPAIGKFFFFLRDYIWLLIGTSLTRNKIIIYSLMFLRSLLFLSSLLRLWCAALINDQLACDNSRSDVAKFRIAMRWNSFAVTRSDVWHHMDLYIFFLLYLCRGNSLEGLVHFFNLSYVTETC